MSGKTRKPPAKGHLSNAPAATDDESVWYIPKTGAWAGHKIRRRSATVETDATDPDRVRVVLIGWVQTKGVQVLMRSYDAFAAIEARDKINADPHAKPPQPEQPKAEREYAAPYPD